jgi:hypothetical protein
MITLALLRTETESWRKMNSLVQPRSYQRVPWQAWHDMQVYEVYAAVGAHLGGTRLGDVRL